MVGRLNLRNVCDEDLLEMNLKAERLLDSPDSGLPPSPSVSPSPWLSGDRSGDRRDRSGDRSTTSSVCEDESRAATPSAVSFTHQTHSATDALIQSSFILRALNLQPSVQ